MIIPYATDAPIYHFPFATIGLMLANVVVFAVAATHVEPPQVFIDPEPLTSMEDGGWSEQDFEDVLEQIEQSKSALDSYTLQFDRFAPWQWLTTNFMHADLFHLLGNMLFLWAFALIVEGKIGWWRFLLMYLTIGIIYGAIVQVGMLLLADSHGSALGASGVIFGVLAVAVCWAPKNEISCLTWFIYPRTYEVPVLLLGFAYFAMQLFSLGIQQFGMSSEMLHIVGLLVGFPLGLLMIKLDWVDCEGWDLIRVFAGNEGKRHVAREVVVKHAKQVEQRGHQRDRATTIESVTAALSAGNSLVALRLLEKGRDLFTATDPIPNRILLSLINDLHRTKQWSASVPWMELLISQSNDNSVAAIQLKLAQILYQVANRPAKAMRVLDALPASLPEKQGELRNRLKAAVRKRLDEGTGELEFE